MYFTKICHTGSYTPPQRVSNDSLANIMDTNDEWIYSHSGIKARRFSDGENTSDLATKAAESALKKGNINPLDIELIIVATVSGDYTTPSTACIVQSNIGAKNAVAFDISAACSGFIFGLSIADKYIKGGVYKNALVIGTEVLSKYIDFSDRVTAILFGDGSGCAYLERSDKPGIIAESVGSDGTKSYALTGGYSAPSNAFNNIERNADIFLDMDGKEIFNFATRQTPKCILSLIEKVGVSLNDVKYIIPHQANSRIIEIIARKIKVPIEKFYINIDEYGNTSSASIPIALNEMFEKELIKKGDKIIVVGFGAGLTWGAMLIEF